MKSLKAILLVAVVAMATMGLNSCKKDSSVPPCVGVWENSVYFPASQEYVISTYIVKADGTYTYTIDDIGTNVIANPYSSQIGVWDYVAPAIHFTGTAQANSGSGVGRISGDAFTMNGNVTFIRKK